MQRKLVWSWAQLLGLLPMLGLLLASLSGAFHARAERNLSVRGLSITLRYPERTCFYRDEQLELTLQASVPCALSLAFGGPYLEAVDEVRITPNPSSSAALSATLEPGHPLRVHVDMRMRELWRQSGTVRASCRDGRTVDLPFSSFVFP